ncbi:MAG: anti-sigma factor family protein, partial [Candidatus Eiseniibacteriota bacterium]
MDNGAKPDNGHVRHLIDAYMDGELGLERNLEVEAHLAGCALCRAEHEARRAVSAAVKDGAPYHRAPDGLRQAVMAGIGAEPAAAPARPMRRPTTWTRPLALAASLLVAIGLGAGVATWTLQPSDADVV